MFDLLSGKKSSKADDLLGQSTAANKMNLLKGYEGVWIQARRNNCYYALNKIISITIAAAFAVLTLSFKKTTQIYFIQETRHNEEVVKAAEAVKGGAAPVESYEAYHILTIYWFLFIYFSLAAMDEMIELFSVINQMEKGALGLFFELNYLIGMFLTGYITWFVFTFSPPEPAATTKATGAAAKDLEHKFKLMYNWLYFHFCYLFFSLFMILIVNGIFLSMNNKAKAQKPARKVEAEEGAGGGEGEGDL